MRTGTCTGTAAGTRTRANSAPLSDLTDAVALPTFGREDACNPDFTVESLRAGVPDGSVLREIDPDVDGNRRVQWVVPSGRAAWAQRATIDDDGEIVRLEDARVKDDSLLREGRTWSGADEPVYLSGWGEVDETGTALHALRHRVNLDRLAMAGVLLHGVPNDGGAYGNRFTGGRSDDGERDVASIAKLIRADLKRAQTFGAIPDELTYRVSSERFAGGQAINVTVEGASDSLLDMTRPNGDRAQHPWAGELDATLQVIGDQWQDAETDTMTDYFNVRYYLQVRLRDERTTAWHREQREAAAAKRAASR
ncbi:hypothetical protein [Microbacterium sp.]|uniref:hypothetical protein n=1 Tax=Microbacterium sp. TaxID=51671 RepID=UPI003A890812